MRVSDVTNLLIEGDLTTILPSVPTSIEDLGDIVSGFGILGLELLGNRDVV